MLIRERTLLVSVALDTRSISARCQPRLLEFEATMRIVTITALHRAFEYLVVERFVEVRLNLTMTAHA